MTDVWAKVDHSTGVVLSVECASEEWVVAHCAANPDAGYMYMPTDMEAPDYAGVGYTWDAALDRFVSPAPYPSWEYEVDLYMWKAPVPYPGSGGPYIWDEETQSWVEIVLPSQLETPISE